jgi:hypothetical protein
MKLKDIQPNTVYAYYAAQKRDHDGFDYADEVYFMPDQLTAPRPYDKGKIIGMILQRPWYAQGKATMTWKRKELRLSHIQELYPIFKAEVAEERAAADRRREENQRVYQENQVKQAELHAYLNENRERLVAIGLPMPSYLPEYKCSQGTYELSLNIEQFQNLLERLEA